MRSELIPVIWKAPEELVTDQIGEMIVDMIAYLDCISDEMKRMNRPLDRRLQQARKRAGTCMSVALSIMELLIDIPTEEEVNQIG